MKKFLKIIFPLFALIIFFSLCKKTYDLPPVKSTDAVDKINISQIKMKYSAGINYKFTRDSNLYCIVIADEVSGNLYKEVYVKDVTGALHVKFVNPGGLFIGDSIRININGAILNENNKLIQLDSVDSEKNVVKLSSGSNPQPISLTIQQVIANTSATNSIQSKLIRLDNVEFLPVDQNQPYANSVTKGIISRVIKSCDGNTLTVRTSGYSYFANNNTPSGNGSFIGIASQYGNTMQMIIRNLSDINMQGTLCSTVNIPGTYLNKDFQDNSITSGGWTQVSVTNTQVAWATSSFSSVINSPYAKIYGNVNSSNVSSENWLISPTIDLSASINPVLTFSTAASKNAGTPLAVMVSTSYVLGMPSAATWTQLPCVLSPTTTSYVYTSSGDITMNAYKSTTTRIAFKYMSTSSAATSYELDNILLKEK